MKKRFKAHRKIYKKIIFKVLSFVSIVIFIVTIVFNIMYKKITEKLTDTQVINILLNNNDFKIPRLFSNNGISFIVNYALGLDINNKHEIKNTDIKDNIDKDIKNNLDDDTLKPIVYIYNTHQTEEYRKININDYNVTPNVMHASYILKNKLSDLGINTLVESNNIKEILDINGWSYRNSYKASKMLAQDALEKNPSIKYVIDLHRDSVDEKIAKVTIDGKDYAKIMIVLGKGHEGYDNNLNMASRINNYLKEFNENITRGIDIKQNSGIYNQDLSPNAVLIEVGGPYNDINSVKNSLEVLASVYKRVIDEDEKKEQT